VQRSGVRRGAGRRRANIRASPGVLGATQEHEEVLMSRIVPDVWTVPDRIRERVGARPGRQRLIFEDGHALLVLHEPPGKDDRERAPQLFWRSPDGIWRGAPGRDGIAALRAHLDLYASRAEALDEQCDAAASASDYFEVLQAARPVLRSARNLHAALQSLRDRIPDDPDVLAARDRAYEVERTAELTTQDAESGMQFTTARRAEEQARVSERIAVEGHRLNLLAAVCLPITAVGSVLGVNLPSGLELLPEPATFWFLVLGSFALGLLLRARMERATAPGA
jgi:hypothetical protein